MHPAGKARVRCLPSLPLSPRRTAGAPYSRRGRAPPCALQQYGRGLQRKCGAAQGRQHGGDRRDVHSVTGPLGCACGMPRREGAATIQGLLHRLSSCRRCCCSVATPSPPSSASACLRPEARVPHRADPWTASPWPLPQARLAVTCRESPAEGLGGPCRRAALASCERPARPRGSLAAWPRWKAD